MKKAHGFLFIICGAGLHNRAYQNFQKSSADGIDHNCHKESPEWITESFRQNSQQDQSGCCHTMSQDHGCTVPDPVHKSYGSQIHQQLNTEIKCNQQGDLLQRYSITALKCQKQ